MASIFGAEVLGMGTEELIVFFLVVQGTAFVGSLVFGLLADGLGNKRTILLTLVVWILVVVWAYVLGLFCASRSLQGLFTPEANSAEFFGFYAVAGKFASIFGPLIYGLILSITGSLRKGILSPFAPSMRRRGGWKSFSPSPESRPENPHHSEGIFR